MTKVILNVDIMSSLAANDGLACHSNLIKTLCEFKNEKLQNCLFIFKMNKIDRNFLSATGNVGFRISTLSTTIT